MCTIKCCKKWFNLIVARSARVFEDQIKKVVSCLQENLNKGIPEVGLPSFDPLKVEADTIDFDRLNSDLIS